MKKVFIVLLSMLFVLGAFTVVYADDGGMDSVRSAIQGSKVMIGGDARVRGIWKDNWDMNDDVDADDRYWDQRIRLKITAKVGDAEVRSRIKLTDGKWNGGDETAGNVEIDYGYLHIPVGPVTFDLGRQNADWTKFFEWNQKRDRAKVTYKLGDTTVGAYTDKIVDTFATGTNTDAIDGDNLDDVDDYAIFAVHSIGNIDGGLLLFLRNDSVTDDNDARAGSLFVNATVAGLSVRAELAMVTGDAIEYIDIDGDTVDDSQWGGFVSASKGLNGLTISGLLAYAANGYVADNHFTPTVMVGTDNPTALADFGGIPGMSDADLDDALASSGITDTSSTMDTFLLAATASYDATPDLKVYGRVAYMNSDNLLFTGSYAGETIGGTFDDVDLDFEHTATELDLGLSYQIAQNISYHVDFGYMMPNIEIDGEDMDADNAMSLAHKVQINF